MTTPWVKPPLETNGLCFFDCETTGLDPLADEIIQIAVVVTDFTGREVRREGMWRILPARDVPAEVAVINGYNADLWSKDGMPLFQAMTQIMGKVQQTIFVAHNAAFDWPFFAEALKTCNMRWAGDYHRVDTVALAWPLLTSGAVPNVKLATLADYFGVSAPTHDALADVRACREIYLHLMDLWQPQAVAS